MRSNLIPARLTLLTCALAMPFAIACNGGGGTDGDDGEDGTASISGLYETRKQTEAAGCSGGEEVIPIPFFRLEEEGDVVNFFACRAEDDCDESPDFDWQVRRVDGEWLGESHSAYVSEQEQACAMFYQERFLEFNAEKAKATLERYDYTAFTSTVQEDQCIQEGEEWFGQGGTCGPFERIVGDKI